MINETILSRIRAGETITPEDVLRIEGEEKLNALKIEATRRAQSEAASRALMEQRQNHIQRLIFVDRQSELHRRTFEQIQHEKLRANEEFDHRAQIALDAWTKSATAFRETFAEIVPEIQAFHGLNFQQKQTIRDQIENVKTQLRERGAMCQASCFNNSGIGESPIEVRVLPPIEFNDEPPNAPAKAA